MDHFYKVQVKMFSYACLLCYQVGAVYFEFTVYLKGNMLVKSPEEVVNHI